MSTRRIEGRGLFAPLFVLFSLSITLLPFQSVIARPGPVKISAQTPSKWNVTLEPSKIDHLEPGSVVTVTANLIVPDKTIAGDYLTTFTANNANTNSSVSFRLTITTSWLAGWLGVLIILIAIGKVYILIRKYGRR